MQQPPGFSAWESACVRARDGARLSGCVGNPIQLKRTTLQAVVLVHGFAAERTENGLFTEIGAELVRSGYLVMMYDWRGIGESDGDFSRTNLDLHASDFRRVVRWLRRQSGLDSTRVCAVGFSLGAAVVGLSLKRGLRLGATSFWSPAVRPRLSMWPRYNTPELRRELEQRGFVAKPDSHVRLGAEILRSLQTTDLGCTAFDLGLPLLVCHGTDDARIPIEHSREVFSASTGRNLLLAEFAGASHSFKPAQEHRFKLFGLFSRWLGDKSFRKKGGRLRIARDEQSIPSPILPPALLVEA
jgi:alpha-beta hydrolase superfamily lysophospholipase